MTALTNSPPHSPSAARVAEILEREGLHAALCHLNARTRHRFTGIYEFDPPMLRGRCLVDRENPTVRSGGDAPMHETYCAIVAEDEAHFETSDALREPRLEGHVARAGVQAYCGIPLRDASGRCFASLCHWDARPRVLAPAEHALLLEVAPLVARAALAALARA